MSKDPKSWKFDVLAMKDGVSSIESCENWDEYQKAAREFLNEGFKTMSVYGYSDSGFERKRNFVRSKNGTWIKFL